ncbi:MAG TPA: hypothetical protein VIH90_05130 [Candidatus Saccharimonadales bacterium]
MRKQYHFWPGEKRLDAWDIDHLVKLSTDFKVEDVKLEDIKEIDSSYWFNEYDKPTVRKIVEHAKLIEDVDTSYPIILGPDNRVMDGMHRIARALLNNQSTIRAVRFTELPEPDYRDCSPSELPY